MIRLILPILFLALNIYATECPTSLAAVSVIQNDFRECSISNLGNLYNNNFDNGQYYIGDGATTLFEMGFARGIWAAGFDPNGNFAAAASGYSNDNNSDFRSGPIIRDSIASEELCSFFTRAWKVTRDQVETMRIAYDQGNLLVDNIPLDILEWPAIGNPYIDAFDIIEEMAPFYDSDLDNIYDPMRGDYPIPLKENSNFVPHQFRFYVFNDWALHSESKAASLEMEFHVIDFVVDCDEESESEKAVFTRLRYINKSNVDIRDFKMGIWDDTDLGCLNNDYFGCSENLNCSYVYNEGGIDTEPSPLGCFSTPVPDEFGVVRSLVFVDKNLEGFSYFNNGAIGDPDPRTTDPSDPLHYYNYLSGLWRDGTPITSGGDGFNPFQTNETRYAFSDFPNQENAWSMQEAGIPSLDRRTVSTFLDDIILQPGESGSVDFIDYVLVDDQNVGLDIFNIYEEKINEVKTDFIAMMNGTFECGQISDVKEFQISTNEFSIYPNPSSERINISFDEAVFGKLEVNSVNGTRMIEQNIDFMSEHTFDVSDFSAGVYIVSFSGKEGVQSYYFVKN